MTTDTTPADATPVFRYAPGTIVVKIEHERGNTIRGPIDIVFDTHLATGWRLAEALVEPDPELARVREELDASNEKLATLVDLAAQIPVSADEGRWIRQQLFTILGAQLSTTICPDCRDGKHGACIGEAWDADKDEITSCKCAHTAVEAGR